MSREKAKQSAARAAEDHLQELRVDKLVPRRHSLNPALMEKEHVPKLSSRSTDYVFVNQAYDGSRNALDQPRLQPAVPVTSVIREQYWTCSKWPLAQRILTIAVGILFGAVVGLVVTMTIRGKNANEVIGSLFPELSRTES